MTLDELERTLPNGLHDAELIGVQINLAERMAVLEVNVDVSNSADSYTELETRYRLGRLLFSRLQYIVVEPPRAPSDVTVSLVSTGTDQPRTAPTELPALADGSFQCWFFLVQWNSFIHIAARSVTLEWTNP